MAQLSTLPSYAVAAIAKAARAEVSMFENPFYIESPPESLSVLYAVPERGNVTHFVHPTHCESNCISAD